MDLKSFRNIDLYTLDSGFDNKMDVVNSHVISPSKKSSHKRTTLKQRRNQLLTDQKDPAKIMISLSPIGFLQGPELIELRDKVHGSPKKHINTRNLNMKESDGVMISFLPQCKLPIKEMLIKMTLKNTFGNDIRVIDLVLTVDPKVIKFSIEMDTKARVPKHQDLPLVNLNNFEVTIQPMFEMIEGERSNFILNLQKIKLKKKSKEMYRVQYCSKWINRSQARLTLINLQTNEKIIYNILGISGKPLSEDTLFVISNVNESKTLYIPLQNSTGKIIEYTVDCEIPNAKFENKITLKPSSIFRFPITYIKTMGGEFHYVVKFINKERKYIWFLITILVEGSSIIEIKDIVSTFVR